MPLSQRLSGSGIDVTDEASHGCSGNACYHKLPQQLNMVHGCRKPTGTYDIDGKTLSSALDAFKCFNGDISGAITAWKKASHHPRCLR